jgi:hypothetical protein
VTIVEQLRWYHSGEHKGALGIVANPGFAQALDYGRPLQQTSAPSTEMPEARMKAAERYNAVARRLAALSGRHRNVLAIAYDPDGFVACTKIDLETAVGGGVLRETREVAELAALVAALPQTWAAWHAEPSDGDASKIPAWLRSLDARCRLAVTRKNQASVEAAHKLARALHGVAATMLSEALAAFEAASTTQRVRLGGRLERRGQRVRLLTAEEAAAVRGTTARAVRQDCAAGKYPAATKKDGAWRIPACCVRAAVTVRKAREAADVLGVERAAVEVPEHECEAAA